MTRRSHAAVLICSWLALAAFSSTLKAGSLSKAVCKMDTLDGIEVKGSAMAVPEGPNGEMAWRVDGGFEGRFDLKAMGIEPRDYDLLKIEVKADRGAFLRLSLENYPEPGELSHWYVLDAMRGQFEWRTIWIDLTAPEEIKRAGTYKGMSSEDPTLRGLLMSGHVKPFRRRILGAGQRLWLRNLRFSKQAVHIDWDQRLAPYRWDAQDGLVFTYPLTVSNRLARPITAELSLLPFQVMYAHGGLSQELVALAANETKTVQASIALPASVAERKEQLYCERFEARACAQEIPDSEVTILRSADPIHLTVTVPIPEDKLRLPLLGRRKDLPEFVTTFDEKRKKMAVELAAKADPEQLWPAIEKGRLEAGGVYKQGLSSAAYLYDYTGERKYLKQCEELLMLMPDLFARNHAEWAKEPVRRISDGIVTGNTLGVGFQVGGTQRPPYIYSLNGNSRGGVMSGVMNNFDLVSADLDEAIREKFIEEFLLPAGIQCRNHYIGPGNQQSTVNYVTMYAGLVTRNWPLVSFAYSSEHGVLNNIIWAFDDDGLCIEGHYQTYTINPILHTTELLYRRGIDLYSQRFHSIVRSKGAEAINMAYRYPITQFLEESRFAGKPFLEGGAKATDGYHLSASTLLRWKGLAVSMNWGTHIMRGAHDRCALWIRPPKEDRDRRPLGCGGGAYTHDSFCQSVIIIDEGIQTSVPADILSVDVTGPVQHVMATSDKHFPGTTITRTFALIDRHVLVVDRVVSDRPRTVDWRLNGVGSKFSIATEQRGGSWTSKPDDTSRGATFGANVESYRYAKTDATWQEGEGRLSMLGEKGTEIMAFTGSQKTPNLMVRRANTRKTHFVALFSLGTQSVEQVPVKKQDGVEADAVGIKVLLRNGKAFHVLVSYEPEGTEVELGGLKTTGRFVCDWEE